MPRSADYGMETLGAVKRHVLVRGTVESSNRIEIGSVKEIMELSSPPLADSGVGLVRWRIPVARRKKKTSEFRREEKTVSFCARLEMSVSCRIFFLAQST